jgi:ABC-type multidrug transport system fused ATPase/permease subunit
LIRRGAVSPCCFELQGMNFLAACFFIRKRSTQSTGQRRPSLKGSDFMSLININNLTFSYHTSYDNIFENVSFQIDTNWKLGLTGRNGRGKTTFLNLLMGKYEYSGSIQAAVTFDYFPYEAGDKNCNTIALFQQPADRSAKSVNTL